MFCLGKAAQNAAASVQVWLRHNNLKVQHIRRLAIMPAAAVRAATTVNATGMLKISAISPAPNAPAT